MTVGIIGAGAIGSAVAADLDHGGGAAVLASRDPGHAGAVADSLGAGITAAPVKELLAAADTVVLAVPFEAIAGLVSEFADEFAHKLVLDASNAVVAGADGTLSPLFTDGTTAGSVVRQALPATARYAKAFGTLGAADLRGAAWAEPAKVLFFAGDDDAVADTEAVIRAAGFTPVRVGGSDQVHRIETGGDLHQYGGLQGRTVTADEAATLL